MLFVGLHPHPYNAVELEETPLYPEGGGQPADHGTINGVVVHDVQRDAVRAVQVDVRLTPRR